MYKCHLPLLFSLIILLSFCTNLFSWAQGIIIFSYRDATYMMRPNDVEPTLITQAGFSAPSPDGRFLGAIDAERHDVLHILNLHTSRKIRSLTLQVHSFVDISWSPDGRWLVYAGNPLGIERGHREDTELFLISPDGRLKRQLPDQIDEKPIGFVWASDARSVFYNLSATGRRGEIWEVSVNGQENPRKHLPFHEGARFLSRYPFYSFSPSGKEIAYTPIHEGVFVANANGMHHREVANHGLRQFFQVDWSPNGRHLVFSADTFAGDAGLYIFSFESQAVRRLIAFPEGLPFSPRWIHDSLAVHPSNKMAATWGTIKRSMENRQFSICCFPQGTFMLHCPVKLHRIHRFEILGCRYIADIRGDRMFFNLRKLVKCFQYVF